jgi:hypothetical protein
MMDWCKHGLPKTSWCWHCEKEEAYKQEEDDFNTSFEKGKEEEEKKKEGIVIRI